MLTLKRHSKYVLLLYLHPKFHSVLSYRRFQIEDHFETSATKDCQMTVNTTWSSAICYWCLRVPTVVGFALWPVLFELQAILSQVHRMSSKVTLDTIRSNMANFMYYWCLQVSNISLFPSMTNGFRVTGHFATSAPNDTNMTLNTTG